MSPDRGAATGYAARSGVRRKLAVEMICPYEPGMPVREVKQRLGLERIIKLASNENPLGPSPHVIERLNRERLELHVYPDYDGWYLRRAIAHELGTSMDSVVVGAGSSDLMRLIADVYLGPETDALVADLCFPVYANASRIEGARVVAVPLDGELRYDMQRMLEAVTARTRVVFLASPNNPTGLPIPPAELGAFLEKLPENVLCVLDLAYHDYVEESGRLRPMELLGRHANLVLLRTFSKVYGLAGLRVGYAVAATDVTEALRQVRIPFMTSTPAQVGALAALEDREHAVRSAELNAAMRVRLARGLEAIGARPYPSSANFVLAEVGAEADEVFEKMLRRGVIVRPQHEGRLRTCLRITTGTEEETESALGALEEVLTEWRRTAPRGGKGK